MISRSVSITLVCLAANLFLDQQVLAQVCVGDACLPSSPPVASVPPVSVSIGPQPSPTASSTPSPSVQTSPQSIQTVIVQPQQTTERNRDPETGQQNNTQAPSLTTKNAGKQADMHTEETDGSNTSPKEETKDSPPWAWIFGIILSAVLLPVAVYLIKLRLSDSRDTDDYISTIVHDLRTPLTAIKNYIALLQKGSFGPIQKKVKAPLDTVASSTDQMSSLVNNLLDASQLKAGKVKLDISNFPIKPLVEDTVSSLGSIARQKGIELGFDNIQEAEVSADRIKVRQILTNILGNALKFTKQGEVIVSAVYKERMFEVSVRDTGIGIPQDQQSILFTRFGQLQNNGNKSAGTGLGLYVSRELARKMGGDLRLVDSKMNKGSTFSLFLPLSQ